MLTRGMFLKCKHAGIQGSKQGSRQGIKQLRSVSSQHTRTPERTHARTHARTRIAAIRKVLALVAVLNHDRSTRGIEELGVKRHVPLRAARINLDTVEAEHVGKVDVALVVDPEFSMLAAGAAVEVEPHFHTLAVAFFTKTAST